MSLQIVSYREDLATAWDEFCATAHNSTFLHTRRFLGYHGDRFDDASILFYEEGLLVGVMPAARVGDDRATVVSHAGITYGGIVHAGRLAGNRMSEALDALRVHYAQSGCASLVYKLVPFIYSKIPAQDDSYALFRHGAVRFRCDLSCSIDLSFRRELTARRRRALKKAAGLVSLSSDISDLEMLWAVLQDNLERKHGALPVHTLDEMKKLVGLFPEQILLRCAKIDDKVVAGVVLFDTGMVRHAQYIASSETGYDACALDAVFNAAIDEAARAGCRYFDFGTSNEQGGRTLNDGLYRFKHEFGGGGVVHEFYDLNLA